MGGRERRAAHGRDFLGEELQRFARAPVAARIAERDRDVRMVVRWVEHRLGRDDPDIDIGHQRLELRKARHQPVGGEAEVGR
jgi:hypothetical protein